MFTKNLKLFQTLTTLLMLAGLLISLGQPTVSIAAALAEPISVTVSITDGAGHTGIPLAGTITVTPGGATYATNPLSGKVTFTLDQATSYTLAAAASGYASQSRAVSYNSASANEAFTLQPDPDDCPSSYTAGTAQVPVTRIDEGFESVAFPPSNWTNIGNGPRWVSSTDAYAGSGSAFHTTSVFQSDSLVTPTLSIPTNAQFSFYQKWSSLTGTRPEIKLWVTNGTTRAAITTFSAPASANTWSLASANIPSSYWDENWKIELEYTTPNGQSSSGVWVDNITLSGQTTVAVCNAISGGLLGGYIKGFDPATHTDTPISGAVISCAPIDSCGLTSIATDVNGLYAFWQPAGSVSLTASASDHFPMGPLSVLMTDNNIIQQNFLLSPAYTLDLTIANSAGGTVTRSADGPYRYGGQVTLTAHPSALYHVPTWGGDASGTAETVTVTITGNMSVTAEFAPYQTDLQTAMRYQTTGFNTIRYIVIVTNAGPDPADGARVEDTFGTSLGSVTWTCAAANDAVCPHISGAGDINETIASLPAGGRLTYTIDASLLSMQVQNSFTVYAPSGVVDALSSNNSDSVTVYRITLPIIYKS